MKLTSPSFDNNGFMPDIFSHEEGDGINPELGISDIPKDTRSLALTIDDIDAPGGSFMHWIVFNIPPHTTVIEQDSIPGKQAMNDARRKNYSGPRPPSGAHRYVFTVFALDTTLDMEEGVPKDKILKALHGHILAHARLTGKYSRERAAVAF